VKMGMSKRLRSQRGTTLLEVLIAVAVASLALISFITLIIGSMDVENHARKVTEATLLADEKLKEVERTGFPAVGQTEGDIGDDPSQGFTYRMTVSETSIEQVREVDVDVLWDRGRRSVTLVGYLARQ